MQWLAFEPEHALIFARPRGGPGGPPPGDGEGPPGESPDGREHGVEGMPWKRQTQQPLTEPISTNEAVGYLHTYAPKHPLHLLYIDGLSAGKTSNGTLDTQDRLLLNLTTGDVGGPMGGEMARAKGLCDLAATVWEDRIDGILRLEGGFEIILCDFEKHLERTDIVSVTSRGEKGHGPIGGWEYIKAITSRYHGIGNDRVTVDHEKFVSVYAQEVKGLWDNDVQSDVRMPRLTNVSPSDLSKIKDDVTAMILGKDWDEEKGKGRDWQAVADMVVARYSAPLHHITTHSAFQRDKEALAVYLQGLLRPFIDSTARNASKETQRCVSQLLPPLPSLSIPPASLPPLAHRALHTVTTRICDSLLTSLSIATSPTPHSSFSTVYAEHAVEVVAELVQWLNWTSWKECGACGDEEVCFVPIWPMGSAKDHAKPKCRGEKEVEGRMGYWGLRRSAPPGKGGPHGDGKKGGRWWKMER
ncbi:hypothetical protein BU25DRAFT_336421 [Macroventuria anomochaeta]|uniref:Uncharacterized protein n=1 Tax=Macroventuria anomochaeta TaxID=301207 RepID=A0ACB6S7G6_9PLEO|nr:uncharacterized protein BU25DRAFT_336421 [Macroventuria anomochaeta]KAF2630151.1 hypothetical protein BU25DRAFT_336421 [Macroventuria anomochaeta]